MPRLRPGGAAGAEPELVDADPGEGEHPAPEAVPDLLYESMAAMREGTRLLRSRQPFKHRKATRYVSSSNTAAVAPL